MTWRAAPRTGFCRARLTNATSASFPQPNPEMSLLVSTILRGSRPFVSRLPPPLGASQISHIFRVHSWSNISQPANWSHLNDIYSRAVDTRSKELPGTPDERWAMQSRSRMATLTAPKGPYAGKTILPSNPHDFLIYQSRTECRGEKRKRCRRTEQATIHLTEEQGAVRTQANCTTRKERL
jgi:hypothetical protein